MAGDKFRLIHQITALYGVFAETEMAYCKTARFLAVILEIALSVKIGVIADYFMLFLLAPTVPSLPSP